MRFNTYNIVVTPAAKDAVWGMFPISRGPYAGDDLLLVMDDLCGCFYVVRASMDGKHLSTSEKVRGEAAVLALVKRLKETQSNVNSSIVTGDGRWGCE